MPKSSKWSPYLKFPNQNPVCNYLHPYVLHAQTISFFWNWSPKLYMVSSTDHKVPHYVVFSTPPLSRPS
jgi:hypothetical protein